MVIVYGLRNGGHQKGRMLQSDQDVKIAHEKVDHVCGGDLMAQVMVSKGFIDKQLFAACETDHEGDPGRGESLHKLVHIFIFNISLCKLR